MSDQDALLAAIREHPDEDTPRLMYADWLDENLPDKIPSLWGSLPACQSYGRLEACPTCRVSLPSP